MNSPTSNVLTFEDLQRITGYLCRLRGIETITLTDAHELADGVMTNRRKGSRDNIVRWTPRLRAAWDGAKAYRAKVWASKSTVVPMRPDRRYLIVASHGGPPHLLESSRRKKAHQGGLCCGGRLNIGRVTGTQALPISRFIAECFLERLRIVAQRLF